MASVETVNGPIDVEQLGRTLIHEHFRTATRPCASSSLTSMTSEAEWNAAIADAHAVKGNGIATVVEPSAMYLHRDADFSKRVADESGLQVVLATGIYTYDHLPQALLSRNEDQLADIFVHEVENGIQGTGIKAAFIKCAADEPGLTPNVEKVHRAAARASHRTSKPIMAHSRPASGTGPEQMRIFAEEGVEPAKVQVAHTGDTDDLDYIERLLETGCYIGLDRYGIDIYLPRSRSEHDARPARARLRRPDVHLTGLLLDDRLVPARDPGVPEGERGAGLVMTFLFDKVIPELKERGMTDEQLDQMMVENPKRWLGS